MPRSSEIQYFADRLAGLIVSAAQATSSEEQAGIRAQLEETFVDVLSLLSHDALPDRPTVVPLARVVRVDGEVRA